MGRWRRWWIFFAGAVLFTHPNLGAAASFSLDQALETALSRSPVVQASRHGEEEAEARIMQALSAWYPRAQTDLSYRSIGPIPELSIDPGIVNPFTGEPIIISRKLGNQDNASAGLSVGWRAYDFGVREARIRAAKAAEKATQFETGDRAAAIAYALRTAYFTTLFTQEVVGVTGRALETVRAQRADAQAQLEAGLGTKLTVASAEARVAELESRSVQATQDHRRAEAALRILLDVEDSEPLELVDSLEAHAAQAPTPPQGESPTLEKISALRSASAEEAASAQSALLPTLDLFATGAYQYPHTITEIDEAGFTYAAGAMLSWQWFDGGFKRGKRDEARAQTAKLGALEQAKREDLQRLRTDAQARVETAAGKLAATKRQLETAETYFEAAKSSKLAGLGTGLEVQTAERAVDGARMALSQARFESALAYADWLHVCGKVDG